MNTATGETILYGYALLWLLTFVVYQLRKRTLDAGSLLLGSYFVYAVISIFLFRSEYYPFEAIRVMPFGYLYGMLMLAFYPVLRFDAWRIAAIQRPSRWVLLPVCLVFIAASLSQIPDIMAGFADRSRRRCSPSCSRISPCAAGTARG